MQFIINFSNKINLLCLYLELKLQVAHEQNYQDQISGNNGANIVTAQPMEKQMEY